MNEMKSENGKSKILNKEKSFLNKRLILGIATTCFLMICTSLGVSAYFTANRQANNSFTIGHVTSKIVEDFDPPNELKPGTSFKKQVSVKNIGPNDCYVRVLVTFSDDDIKNLCDIDYNTTDWTYDSRDQYWYYNYILKDGETTKPLFNTVTIKNDADEDKLVDFDINIYHESSSTILMRPSQ